VPNASFRSYAWLYPHVGERIRGYCGLGVTPWLLALAAVLLVRRGLPSHLAGERSGSFPPSPRWGEGSGVRGEDHARLVRRFAWTAVVMAILMLGPCLIWLNRQRQFPLPYFLVYHLVPGGKAMRVPTRFIFPLLLCLAVLGGFAVAHVLRTWRNWRPAVRAVVAAGFVVLLCVDYAVTDSPGVVCEPRAQFPPVYDYLAASGRERPVLELPAAMGGQFRYLYHQTAHWRPLLGGESGSFTPAALETAKRTQGPPTEQTLRFLELTPARTLVIHLDAYPAAERAAWRQADLTGHGFRRAGPFGQAVVWERDRPLPASAAKLRVARPDLQFTRAFLRDRLDVSLVLAPADRDRPWRSLERGLGDLTIEVVAADGTVQRFTKPFHIPPYLLPGETAAVKLDKVRGAFAGARRVRVRGPLVQEFEADVGPVVTATLGAK